MAIVTIPFKPRDYQKPLLKYIMEGGQRAFAEWHRRAGKDLCLWNLMIRKASEKVGLYYYFLPTYAQGKKVIWDGITNDGIRFIDFVPNQMVENRNETEMKIVLKTGSIIQVIGTDKFDSIRGTNPIGCVFSEYAYQNPMAWDVVRPILKANGGWAAFNTTPQGENHSHDLGEMAKTNKEWFYQVLTIDDTNILTPEDIDQERAEGMDEDMIQQEYYCSHKIGARGAYYAALVNEIEEKGQISSLPIEKHLPVDLFQDIGRNDSYSIGFLQRKGKEMRFIDFYEDNGKEVAHYIKYVTDLGYRFGHVYLPHDAKQKRVEAKNSVWEQWEEAGFKVKLVPKHEINSGIQEVRKKLPRMWFDKERCKQLVRCLKNYSKTWDATAKVFRPYPNHDWSSHASDMVRYVAMGWEEDEQGINPEEAAQSYLDAIEWPDDKSWFGKKEEVSDPF